jgi:hypothetical protein
MSERSQAARAYRRGLWPVLALAALLALVSLSCSVGQALVERTGGAPPTPTKTPRPTFTPLPAALTPLADAQAAPEVIVRGTLPPGVTAQAPTPAAAAGAAISGSVPGGSGSTSLTIYATDTPLPSPTPGPDQPTPEPTGDFETNRPTREAGPRPLPTPYVVVNSATLNGRRGPGTTYERIGQAKKGEKLMILAQSEDGGWFQVCCMANQPVWVSAELVTEMGAAETVGVATAAPTPFPTQPVFRAPQPTPTITPTPAPPFDIARGPEFPIQRDNGTLTIWSKVYEGPSDNEHPLGGYILKVFRNGVDVSDNQQSFTDADFEKTALSEGALAYNLKFEMPNAGEADWEMYLARPGGFRVSPVTKFTTQGDSYRNLVVYIAYWLAR